MTINKESTKVHTEEKTNANNFCDYAECVPFPSASPQFFEGYRIVKCKLTGKETHIDCENCKYKSGQEE